MGRVKKVLKVLGWICLGLFILNVVSGCVITFFRIDRAWLTPSQAETPRLIGGDELARSISMAGPVVKMENDRSIVLNDDHFHLATVMPPQSHGQLAFDYPYTDQLADDRHGRLQLVGAGVDGLKQERRVVTGQTAALKDQNLHLVRHFSFHPSSPERFTVDEVTPMYIRLAGNQLPVPEGGEPRRLRVLITNVTDKVDRPMSYYQWEAMVGGPRAVVIRLPPLDKIANSYFYLVPVRSPEGMAVFQGHDEPGLPPAPEPPFEGIRIDLSTVSAGSKDPTLELINRWKGAGLSPGFIPVGLKAYKYSLPEPSIGLGGLYMRLGSEVKPLNEPRMWQAKDVANREVVLGCNVNPHIPLSRHWSVVIGVSAYATP